MPEFVEFQHNAEIRHPEIFAPLVSLSIRRPPAGGCGLPPHLWAIALLFVERLKFFEQLWIIEELLEIIRAPDFEDVDARTLFSYTSWKVHGIFPGGILLWIYQDKYYRHSLIYFDKFFNDGKELVPKGMDMIPEVESVSECLM